MSGQGFALFEERLAKKLSSKGSGIFSDLIGMFLPFLVPLLQGCFNPKAAMKRKLIGRARLAPAIRNAGRRGDIPEMTFQEAFDLADDMMDVAAEANDSERDLFLADAGL